MLATSLSFSQIENEITLTKIKGGSNVTFIGAFEEKSKIEIYIEISRKIGSCGVTLIVDNDNLGTRDFVPFTFEETDFVKDKYKCEIDLGKEFDGGDGLLYWKIRFDCNGKTYYTGSRNNAEIYITDDENARPFRMLSYSCGFETPSWAKEGVMYQIFVDRFNKGSVQVPIRDDCVVCDDWYTGIPEFAENPGDPLKNNTFFGGTLWGVVEKLDYLCDLGVNILYFCPIFKAYSNHKYDTGDYETVDEMFGGDKAFEVLVAEAKKRGMRIILDGVFNHTGDDSKYFNRYGKYKTTGAYQSKHSKYYDWYHFTLFPEVYESWWGIDILPRINGNSPKVKEYFLGEKGIVRKWLSKGVDGWRLDVADELDEDFLEKLRLSAKTEKSDSLVVGEVWENAADKVSYDKRRKYFRGKQLDSVMNYPVKSAIIELVKYGNADKFYDCVTDIYASYPKQCSNVLLNLIGSHDTDRILTVLAGDSNEGKSNRELSTLKMTKEQLTEGEKRLKVASVLQFTLPGIPMIYYGDEAGMEGYHDPFNRRPYPWGKENKELVYHYKKLSKIKREERSLHTEMPTFLCHDDGLVVFKRGSVYTLINVSGKEKTFRLGGTYSNLLTGGAEKDNISLLPMSAKIIK